MTATSSAADEAILARLAKTDDLAPAAAGRGPVAITIGGKTYRGIATVPVEELALCNGTDFDAMLPAQRSHRSRILRRAAKDGTLSRPVVEALQRKGVLPSDL